MNQPRTCTPQQLRDANLIRDLDLFLIESLIRTAAAHPGFIEPDPIVQCILTLASRVTGDGHVCLDLGQDAWWQLQGNVPAEPAEDSAGPGDDTTLANQTLNSLPSPAIVLPLLENLPGLVSDGSTPTPFVLEETRLYLRRFWNYERLVAEKLRVFAQLDPVAVPEEIQNAIRTYKLQPSGSPLAKGQQDAVLAALERQFTIITGGPGTGKTTIAAVLLEQIAKLAPEHLRLRVRLLAPTGKAAARLDESLRSGLPEAARDRMEIPAAATIDRALGYLPNSPYFRHNRDNPISADAFIVDEASMIDLPKMAKLLDAIPLSARLILLGDKNQLASVDPGSVMAELCDSTLLQQKSVVELTESKRFDATSAVTPLSQAVRQQNANLAWQIASDPTLGAPGKKIALHDATQIRYGDLPREFTNLVKERFADFKNAATPANAFATLAKFRVLCALRRGPAGVNNINRAIEDILFPNRRGEFYDHRVILITTNDYETNLFNGDVGIILPDPDRNNQPAAFFEGRPHPVPCHLLPEHETAFAMTVHKAQGSGFNHVAVILPDRATPLLTRELIYTAITRTETGVDLWTTKETFQSAVQTATTRAIGLAQKLDHPSAPVA